MPSDYVDQAQKIQINAQSALLIELNEPEAWLEAIRRIADRQTKVLAQGLMSDEMSSKRWARLANAIARVQSELDLESMPRAQSTPE